MMTLRELHVKLGDHLRFEIERPLKKDLTVRRGSS